MHKKGLLKSSENTFLGTLGAYAGLVVAQHRCSSDVRRGAGSPAPLVGLSWASCTSSSTFWSAFGWSCAFKEPVACAFPQEAMN